MGKLTLKKFLVTSRWAAPGGAAVVNRFAQHRSRHLRQCGSALFIALIVLVAMTLAAISLVRSVDTANVIAGNFAFKQAAIQSSDLGIEAALTQLPAIVANSLDTIVTPAANSVSPNYWYYPTMRTLDASGAPTMHELGAAGAVTAIDWGNVPIATSSNGYDMRYVIDRLCQGPPPVTDLLGKCFADPPGGGDAGDSHKGGSPKFSSVGAVYYRATVRVSGPRNTISMVQVILAN